MEAIDQLGHYLSRIVAILSRHHAHKQHNALNQTRVFKVQVDDKALEDVLMLLNQIFAELLEKLCVPLDDSLLFFSALSLHLVILFLEPVEDIFELILVSQYLDDSPKESSIDVLDQALAVNVINLLRVFQTQDRGDYVRKLFRVHLPEQLISRLVEIVRLVLS